MHKQAYKKANEQAHMRLQQWLAREQFDKARWQRCAGETNFVYLVEQFDRSQWPQQFIVRIANPALGILSPFYTCPDEIVQIHQIAAAANIAPAVIDADCLLDALPLMVQAYLPADHSVSVVRSEKFTGLARLMTRLQNNTSRWPWQPDQQNQSSMSWSLLPAIIDDPTVPEMADMALRLLDEGYRRGLDKMKLYPSHSDWRPANCLYSHQRWWLVDWDFFGWRPALWDWASLVIGHNLSPEQAWEMLPDTVSQSRDLAWFCTTMALISWHWYEQQQRSSKESELLAKRWLVEV